MKRENKAKIILKGAYRSINLLICFRKREYSQKLKRSLQEKNQCTKEDKFLISTQFKKEVYAIIGKLLTELNCIKLREPNSPLVKFPTEKIFFCKNGIFWSSWQQSNSWNFFERIVPYVGEDKKATRKSNCWFFIKCCCSQVPILVS